MSSSELEPHLRRRVEAAIDTAELTDGVVLVRAGTQVSIDGTDQHYPFHAHPDFTYLAGKEIPGAVLAVSVAEKTAELFAPHPDAKDRVWHKAITDGRPLTELDGWIEAHKADSDPLEIGATQTPAEALRKVVDEQRVLKDEVEHETMRRAAAATAAGFEALTAAIKPGLSEHQLRAVIDSAFMFNGGDRPAYDSIVAAGSNGAVLHFSPGDRVLEEGDLLLVDAGARVDGYACDVTRTWCVGDPTPEQRLIWETVRDAQELAIQDCVPGVEYRDVHLRTAERMARSLVDAGLMRGEPAKLVIEGAMAVFFPHGIGHFIGVNVHDTNGYADDREPTSVGGTTYLRTDRPLIENMVLTVEPGLYFIDAILDDPETQEKFAGAINWDMLGNFRGMGGVRIEDTIIIRDGAPEVLSGAIPKTISISV